MEKNAPKSLISNVIADAKAQAWADALAQVRSELVLMDPAAVERPIENVAAFIGQVYAWVAERRAVGEDVAAARLELLAKALARAEHDYVWQPPVAIVEDMIGLLAAADRWFRVVEDEVESRICRGELDEELVPRRRGSSRDDRCSHILRLVELLRFEGTSLTRRELNRAEKIADRLYGAVEAGPDYVSVVELRDRAYSLRRREYDVARAERSNPPVSGTFALAVFGAVETATA